MLRRKELKDNDGGCTRRWNFFGCPRGVEALGLPAQCRRDEGRLWPRPASVPRTSSRKVSLKADSGIGLTARIRHSAVAVSVSTMNPTSVAGVGVIVFLSALEAHAAAAQLASSPLLGGQPQQPPPPNQPPMPQPQYPPPPPPPPPPGLGAADWVLFGLVLAATAAAGIFHGCLKLASGSGGGGNGGSGTPAFLLEIRRRGAASDLAFLFVCYNTFLVLIGMHCIYCKNWYGKKRRGGRGDVRNARCTFLFPSLGLWPLTLQSQIFLSLFPVFSRDLCLRSIWSGMSCILYLYIHAQCSRVRDVLRYSSCFWGCTLVRSGAVVRKRPSLTSAV